MEQWKEYRLGDFMEFNPKRSLSKNTIARKITMDKLVPHTRDIYDWTYEPYSGGAKFQNGDTLMARITPCLENGKQAYVSMLNNGETAFGSTEYIVICGREALCDNRFAYYLSLCPTFRNAAIKSMVGTSGRQRAQVDVLENMTMRLPPLSEQLKIVSILSSLDDKIELNRKINSNLEEQAKALYDNYASQVNREARIGDLANEVLDYSHCEFSRVYLLNSSDVTEGTFPKLGLVDNKNLKGHFKKRFRFGDILYSQIRPRNHHYGLVMFNPDRYISSTRLMVIRANKELVSQYLLYQSIISPCVCDEFTLKTETRSGTFPQGNYKDMANIIIPYGTKEQRELIEPKLKSIRETIYSNQKENIILSSLRDSLLPRLMSGEIEV